MAKFDPEKLSKLLDDAGVGKVTKQKVMKANEPQAPPPEDRPKGSRRTWRRLRKEEASNGGHGASAPAALPDRF